MLDRVPLIHRITSAFALMESYLKLNSRQNLNTAAVLAEDFCVNLLNLLYGANFTNLNAEKLNAPAVDLAFRKERLAFQITINDTTAKIRDTHLQAATPDIANNFDRITILFLVNKAPPLPKKSAKFTPCTSPTIVVRDLSSILGDICGLDIDSIGAIAELLEMEISNPVKPWQRDGSLRPANLGDVGGPHLVPSVNILTNKHYPTLLQIRLENRGIKTARGIRLTIRHSETHTVSGAASDNWWKDIGGGRLNPRQLESIKPINPGESVDVLPIPFSEQPKEDIAISMRITGEDMAALEWHIVLSPSVIGGVGARPFSAGKRQENLLSSENLNEAIQEAPPSTTGTAQSEAQRSSSPHSHV